MNNAGAPQVSLNYTLPVPSHTITSNHTFRLSFFHDSLATTGLGDFLIHAVSLLITDSLINPQSDNGKRASLPCCLVAVFTGVVGNAIESCPLLFSNRSIPYYITVGSAAMSPWWKGGGSVDWPVTVAAAAALLRHCWRGRGCPA
jgi:hypothetical protein